MVKQKTGSANPDGMRVSSDGRLTSLKSMAYAAPAIPMAILVGNVLIVLQGVYATHYGLPLTAIALVLLVTRVFDAAIDPLVGYFADSYFVRRGSRKPFIFCGGVLLIVSAHFLYAPTESVSVSYFLFWMLIFFVSSTLMDIPHMAWGGSLAESSVEKNAIYGFRSGCSFLGALLFFCLPYLPFFETRDITPSVLQAAVLLSGAIMIPALLVCAAFVPNGRATALLQRKRSKRTCLKRARDGVRLYLANKPLLIITAAHVCTGLGAGVWLSLLFLFADVYLSLGSVFALAVLTSLLLSIAAIPLWNVANASLGRRRCWALAMGLVCAGFLTFSLMTPQAATFTQLATGMLLVYVGLVEFNIAAPAFISDAADYAEWKFSTECAASYFAVYSFINKSVAALGAAFGLALLGWSGFDAAAVSQSDVAVHGLYAGITWVPVLLFGVAIGFILKIPLSEKRHTVIRKRLELRAKRALPPAGSSFA